MPCRLILFFGQLGLLVYLSDLKQMYEKVRRKLSRHPLGAKQLIKRNHMRKYALTYWITT
jgi:hypothetical protein